MKRKLVAELVGLIAGMIVAIVLLFYEYILHEPRRPGSLSEFEIVIIAGVILAGALSGFVIHKSVIARIKDTIGATCAIAGAVLISPLALYWAIISGSLGGGIGEQLFNRFGRGDIGIFLGVFLSITLTIAFVEFVGAVVSAWLGAAVGAFMQRFRNT